MRTDLARLRVPLYWPAILPTLLLLLLGTLVLSGLEVRIGLRWMDDWHLLQLMGVVIGLAAAAALLLVPYKAIVSRAYLFYAANMFLLVLVLVAGHARNNARRWLVLPGGFDFQPSELMKLTLVVTLARFIRFRSSYKTFTGLWAPFLMTLVPMGLILVQPDLGTALLFIPILFTMLFAAGARARHLLLVILLGAAAIVPLYEWGLRPYQRDRIDGFLVQLGLVNRGDAHMKAMAQDENYQL
ncbi:MAG: FtsW/RodA/SpoVE family cell cycle protein, partial [Planctomycetota bacterium]